MQIKTYKPEFGNPNHIDDLKKGVLYQCGHALYWHCGGECTQENENEQHLCTCEECGDEHYAYDTCDCEGFKPNKNMEFDESTNTFKP